MTIANDHENPPRPPRILMGLRANLLCSTPDPIMAAASTPFVSTVPMMAPEKKGKCP